MRWLVLYTAMILGANAGYAGEIDWQAAHDGGLAKLAQTDPTPVPATEFTDPEGGTHSLADWKGKVVLLNFWATWCAPCIKEMPELSALDAMNEHVEVIGLAYEDTDPDALRQFLAERPVVYPVAQVDVYDPPRDFPTPRGLPLTCLVGPDGRLVETFLGPVTAASLEQAIHAAGGPAPAGAG